MITVKQSVFEPEEIQRFRNETHGCKFVNHLNNAGASLMPDIVTKAIHNHIQLESEIGGYEASTLKATAVEEFYQQAALLINGKPANIAFTASATDSFTRALSSIPFKANDVILTDCDDFISNQIQFLSCQKRFGVRIERIRNAPIGGVDLNDLREKLYALKPKLLAITHIPTNSGLVQPVKEIGAIFSEYKTRQSESWYILDACQSVGQMKLDVEELQCDFLSATNRKFLRGPRGTGFLFVSDRVLENGLEPLFIDMRGAEWIEKDKYVPMKGAIRFEDWEFAYALVIASSEAIKYCRQIGELRIWEHVRASSHYMRAKLSAIKGVRTLDRGPEVGGLVTFTVPGMSPRPLVESLHKRKINVVPSYRNFAVIDFDEKGVQWAIRASPHYYNTAEEIDDLVQSIEELVPRTQ